MFRKRKRAREAAAQVAPRAQAARARIQSLKYLGGEQENTLRESVAILEEEVLPLLDAVDELCRET